MSRWKAAAIHFSISAAVAVIVGALLLGLWYPPPYFHAAGADVLVLLLVSVHLALGPLLTLIVFRAGKRGLRFDLTAIALVQTIALIYGLSIILQSRPVFLVAAVDRFVLVSANEVTDEDLADGRDEAFRTRSWTGPRLVAAELPADPKERSDLIDLAFAGRDIQNLPKYYHSYLSESADLLAKAKPVAQLRKRRSADQELLDQWLSKSGRTESSLVWLPLRARKADMTMLLDAQTAQPLQALAIDPW
jgi:hypothetical protein